MRSSDLYDPRASDERLRVSWIRNFRYRQVTGYHMHIGPSALGGPTDPQGEALERCTVLKAISRFAIPARVMRSYARTHVCGRRERTLVKTGIRNV